MEDRVVELPYNADTYLSLLIECADHQEELDGDLFWGGNDVDGERWSVRLVRGM